nr:TSUP family transporter [Mangrovicoccus ximenensis]
MVTKVTTAAVRCSSSPRAVTSASIAGAAAGFTSMIANAGAPPVQIYLLPQRLARDAFIGTSTVFFATVNWLKLPAFLALGQVNRESLVASALLAPVAVAATLAGVSLVRRIPQKLFYDIIQILMGLVGLKLIADALTG